MSRALRVLAFALVMPACVAHAQGKPCSKSEAAAADKGVDMVVGWNQLHKAWRDYGHCDAGSVSESFTDAILRLMVEWKNVDALGEAMKDEKFKAFVVKHLKSPAAQADHESIYSRVKASCPANHGPMCAELAEIVKRPVKTAPPEPPQPPSKPGAALPPGK
jgi:hypothetical protein